MNVKELKELLKSIPDNYEIRTRSENSNLDNDESTWQLNFSGVITEIKSIHSRKILMLIRGFE